MALYIKNRPVELLVAEVAATTGEGKTEVIRKAVEERRERLAQTTTVNRTATLLRFLEREVWPLIPPELLGQRLSQAEQEAILDFRPDGE